MPLEQELRSYLVNTLPSGCEVITAFESAETRIVIIDSPYIEINIFSDRMDDPSAGEPEAWDSPKVWFRNYDPGRYSVERMPFLLAVLQAAHVAQRLWVERMAVPA